MKKLLCLICSLILILSCVSPISVFANGQHSIFLVIFKDGEEISREQINTVNDNTEVSFSESVINSYNQADDVIDEVLIINNEYNEALVNGKNYIIKSDTDILLKTLTPCAITAASGGNGTVVGSGRYGKGQSVTLTASPNEGYVFENWCENGNRIVGAGETYTFTAEDDRRLIASFILESTYPLNMIKLLNGVEIERRTDESVGKGKPFSLADADFKKASEETDYFEGFFIKNNEYDEKMIANKEYIINSETDIIAKYSSMYTVNVSSDGNGTVYGEGKYGLGLPVTVKAVANIGYSFDGWYENGKRVTNAGASYTFTAAKNVTLVARFKSVDYNDGVPFGVSSLTDTLSKMMMKNLNVGASSALADKYVTSLTDDNDLSYASFYLLRAKQSKATKSSIKISWSKPQKAKKYVVYGAKCGKGNKYKKLGTTSSNTFTYKKLKKNTYYKLVVLAFDSNDSLVTCSTTLHIATAGGKNGNAKTVKLNKSNLKLKKGKSFKFKASAVKANKKQKLASHKPIRYYSSNTGVATVTKKGVIKAKGKGDCNIYAYAQNGVFKKIKVTVK
ncbi:MAG: Ig-like domain-containing protein [Eubacterium sp.]|nr:Ig-like domain-containing protein [Eubacterium sp.]